MNKSEKEHLCQRVLEIVRLKLVQRKHPNPDFKKWVIEQARKKGRLKLRPVAEIIQAAAGLDTESWRGRTVLELAEVFARTPDFERLWAMAKQDAALCQRKNAPLLERERKLRDRIMLGQVKDGEACLAEVKGWTL